MSNKRKGYRRLYHAAKCKLIDQNTGMEMTKGIGGYRYSIDEYTVDISIGISPSFDFMVPDDTLQASDILLPGDTFSCSFRVKKSLVGTRFEGSYVTDIACWKNTITNEEVELETYKSLLDNAAALVGLRFHPQFVATIIDEGFLIDEGNNRYQYSSNVARFKIGQAVELLWQDMESCLFPYGQDTVLTESIFNSPALSWLLSAWNRSDPVDQFVAFFIPLEIILQGYKPPVQSDSGNAIKIRSLLKANSGPEAEALLNYFDEGLKKQVPPSLAIRFEVMAKTAQFADWEVDVERFRRFNRIRNDLVHRGERYMETTESLQKKDICELEKLVTRYLNWALLKCNADLRTDK